MSRLDEQPSYDPWLREKSEKEKMKEEIRAGVMSEMKNKKKNKKIACCSLIFAAVFLFLSLTAVGIAKSGVLEIPVFSKIFTKKSTPERIVNVTPGEAKSFESDIAQKLKAQVEPKIEPGATGQKVDVTLVFTEKELTAFLRSLELSENSPLKNSQAVVTPEGIEVFGEVNMPNQTYLTIFFKPEVADGGLKITLKKIKLGTLSLPASWGNFLAQKFLSREIQDAEGAIRKIGELKSLSMSNGELTADGLVDVLVFTQQNQK